MDKSLALLDQAQTLVVTQAVSFGPKLLVALVILAAGFYAGRWAGKMLKRSLSRLHLEPDLELLLVRVLRILVLALFGVIALQNLGVELLPLIAGLGVAGAGVALAMQGLLSNLVAGLTIILTHPFRIGEYVSIIGVEGVVSDISLFNTVLLHADNSRVVVPNRKIVGEILHNYGHIRQLDLRAQVAYDSDHNQALATVLEVLQANPRVLAEPAPLVQITTLADSGVVIAIKPWVSVADNPQAIGEINQAVLEAFRARGIRMPFPQREVRLLGQG
ncbi:mechanosensitive ion channel family protein [Uliginosibacterium sp. 31-16]|uniref:mechanosensitive ion channel family protein n=1 Tax=Uliginosibacterium sp. 31-16 TaxID=3068315 RepID=UPI00273FC339|nr:mechanosensitive ion channel family protein [Uliginosibacterium sp. 31-16]MDP5239870.1 mechanosensitive ion channel family protein [Uliginosibacterium sp. 31-16]